MGRLGGMLALWLLAIFATPVVARQEQPQTPPPAPPAPVAPVAEPAAAADPAPRGPAAAGKAVEIWVDRTSGVTSAWLDNGVLVHHKQVKLDPAMAQAGGGEGRRRERPLPAVAISLTIAGAELLETAENRGISDAAVAATWNARSVGSLTPEALGAFIDKHGVTVRSFGGGDSFMLRATAGAAGGADAAAHTAWLLLTEPRVNADEMEKWKARTLAQIEERRTGGNNAFDEVISAMFGPQDARAKQPSEENIRAITPQRAQAWLDDALGRGGEGARAMPMEVAIVGEIAVDEAIRLAERYFGSLPARDRIADTTLAERRVAIRADKPPETVTVENWKGSPLVLVGFFGADIRDLPDFRALALAARIMNQRLERLPADENDGKLGTAVSIPASVNPGFGLFLVSTHAKPGSEASASEHITKLVDDLIANGPSPEELSTASQELSNSAARMLADPTYWAWTLSRSSYHGLSPTEIARADRVYRDMPAETITQMLKKYCTPERAIRLIVSPPESKAAPAG